MWIPIFKTGTYLDSNRRERTWSEKDLGTIVARYDPAKHEAPVAIGRPRHNAPAWAWVENLKRDGRVLLAKLKDVVPEFADMIRRKLFGKQFIALDQDLNLGYIGFLGAQPPPVRGLGNLEFGEYDRGTIIETEEEDVMKPGDLLVAKARDILMSPPSHDRHGRMGQNIKFADAFRLACAENLDLAREYCTEIYGEGAKFSDWLSIGGDATKPGELLVKRAREILMSPPSHDRHGRMRQNIKFADAFRLACAENLDLAREYCQQVTRGTLEFSDWL